MDEFCGDYRCRTVGESITKYNMPNDWCAEFYIYEDACPIVCIQVDQVRKTPAMMDLKLRIVENEDDEYPGCMLFPAKKTIAFKVDYISELIKAMEKEL